MCKEKCSCKNKTDKEKFMDVLVELGIDFEHDGTFAMTDDVVLEEFVTDDGVAIELRFEFDKDGKFYRKCFY